MMRGENPLRPLRHASFADADGWISACGRFTFVQRPNGWQALLGRAGRPWAQAHDCVAIEEERFSSRREAEMAALALLAALPPRPRGSARFALKRYWGNGYQTLDGRWTVIRSEGRWYLGVGRTGTRKQQAQRIQLLKSYGLSNLHVPTRREALQALAGMLDIEDAG